MISIEQISKRYGDHQAIENITFEIPKQSIYGLLGPNGAGKTTLIRIINQIIEADTGSIQINGEKLNPGHIHIIGYLPEERGLYKKMKVSEQLLFLGQLRGLERRECISQIKEWSSRLGMSDWLNSKVEDLSKGMAQKIQFIGTVLNQPKLIILDEPFSGFDPVNAELIKEEILTLREKGSTVLFSTHRMESVEELCDHLSLIHHANVILTGKKHEVKNQFRDDTYVVETAKSLNGNGKGYNLLESNPTSSETFENVIKLNPGIDRNQFIQEIISDHQLISFKERIPSINDIFISLTKEA